MATVADHPYGSTLDDLAGAIRSLRPDCPPRETARRLLAYDVPGHTHLVGLDQPGRRAVLVHCGGGYCVAVRFGDHGLDDGGPRIADVDAAAAVDRWVRSFDGYWGWLHPRYRRESA